MEDIMTYMPELAPEATWPEFPAAEWAAYHRALVRYFEEPITPAQAALAAELCVDLPLVHYKARNDRDRYYPAGLATNHRDERVQAVCWALFQLPNTTAYTVSKLTSVLPQYVRGCRDAHAARLAKAAVAAAA